MNPLAANLSSASRPTSATAQPVVRNVADAQATLANRLAERLGLEPGALAGKANDYTPEKVAGRILGFIEQRLQSEQAAGADPSKLKGLLEQARSGVEKGFAEARKILDGMGVLQGKVASDIGDTYQKIQDGFSDLDKRFNPDAALVEGSTNIAAYSERFAAQAETFDMEVTTRDGDRLRISIAQASANWSQSGVVASSNGNGSSVVASSQSGSLQIGAWQVSVEGELDDEERAALEKLFGQVQDLSNKFYAGDLSSAFDRAMALEMDGEQLASMSLRLTQTTVRQATDAYSAVAQDGGQAASAVNSSLIDYAQGLLDALRSANQVAEEGTAKTSLLDMLKGGFSLDERFDSGRLDKAEQLNSRLLDGLQNLLNPALDSSKSKDA
ncbi:DUF5610 domain-containing protein [Pseudomonas anguilliseptica]|uniref:DUF5610 domain-containing protein n=1 Tax=Pseudomonas anguilliseptica TaxID=53406 RepID=A0A1H5IP46_PSEAG|nr:DUF5610 domain-containing protein [Pseudomonas anguilliseptica]SEE41844.1 hypothetical protein SAMN05421553_4747 [Pseudomonas anguilliseptica]